MYKRPSKSKALQRAKPGIDGLLRDLRYKLVLPSEEQLRLELIREQRLLEDQPGRDRK